MDGEGRGGEGEQCVSLNWRLKIFEGRNLTAHRERNTIHRDGDLLSSWIAECPSLGHAHVVYSSWLLDSTMTRQGPPHLSTLDRPLMTPINAEFLPYSPGVRQRD